MKLSGLLIWAAVLTASVDAAAVVSVEDPLITEAPAVQLEKRYKGKIINKEYAKQQEEQKKILAGEDPESSSTMPKPWIRTIYESQVEIVTPTVIAGVTFSAKPPKTTDGLEPWISLNKDGSPKTIRPQMKNGRIKKASPTYDTWFAKPTTIQYTKEQLKAHNMADDQIHEEVEYIDEDQTYHQLNPLIRCTPDLYHKKGLGKDIPSEPFCFPHDNQSLKRDRTYFVTWYSKFFEEDVKNVKIHLSYIKEKARYKGMKRDVNETAIAKRSKVIENGGTILQASFFTSDWISNDQGFFPLTILPEWFGEKAFEHKVLLSIQPDTVKDEEFNHMDKYVVIEIAIGAKVSKEHLTDLKQLEEKWRKQQLAGEIDEIEEGIDYDKYIVMLTMPTCVAIAALAMYIFVWINKRNTDLSHLTKRKFAGKSTKHRRIPFKKNNGYSELPQYTENIEMSKRD